MAMDAGAVRGVTDILKAVSNSHWMRDYFTNLGIDAGIRAATENIVTQAYDVGRICPAWKSSVDMDSAKDDAERYAEEAQSKPADHGQRIHDALNAFLFGSSVPADPILLTACDEAASFLHERFPGWFDTAVGEHCFTADVTSKNGVRMKYGGTFDFRIPHVIMLDFKTCEDGRAIYATEAAQVAAYLLGMGGTEPCMNLYFNRTTGKIQMFKEWNQREIELGEEMFSIAYRFTDIMDEFNDLQKG